MQFLVNSQKEKCTHGHVYAATVQAPFGVSLAEMLSIRVWKRLTQSAYVTPAKDKISFSHWCFPSKKPKHHSPILSLPIIVGDYFSGRCLADF